MGVVRGGSWERWELGGGKIERRVPPKTAGCSRVSECWAHLLPGIAST